MKLMSEWNFEEVIDRNSATDLKTNAAKIRQVFDLNYYEDTIPMWVADMDFACPPKLLDALKTRIDRRIFGYTVPDDQYYESIINWYGRRHGMAIEKEWIMYSNGTVAAIRNCLRAFTAEGDGIIIQPPVYYPFEKQIKETGRTVVRNELLLAADGQYSIDFDDFEEKCRRPDTRMFIYCNPHNPVGEIWSADETLRLMNICAENDVLFFSDEIHCDLIRQGSSFTSALNLQSDARLILATAVNKSFNVAGLHITNLVIKDSGLRTELKNYTGSIGVSPFAMTATVSAYNDCEDWLSAVNRVIDGNLDYLEKTLKTHLPEVGFRKPAGTYLAWLDFRGFGLTENELLLKMADEARLILEGGSIFGACGEGHLRMNIACPLPVLEEALTRIVKVFS